MKVEEIERLLAGFYEGTTTESQEEMLKDYFRTKEVPRHLRKEQELFLCLYGGETGDEPSAPAGLEHKLRRMIDEKAEEELRFFRPNRAKRNWRWVGGIAATFLILAGIGYSIGNFGKELQSPTPEDTFSDPKIAYEVLQSTLREVSANLNNGIEQVNETQKDMLIINKEVKQEIQR